MVEASLHSSSFAAKPRRERNVAEHVFIWLAWALAAAFWVATLTTFGGILQSIVRTPPEVRGGVDFGGVAWLIIDVVGGIIVLGGALAYASLMYARRNRRLDPAGEVATASLYDAVERQGGEEPSGSPADRVRTDRPS